MFKSIHVIDPGAMEAGGHHFALVETLLASPHDRCVEFYTHINLDQRVLSKIQQAGHTANLTFRQNFYECYGSNYADDAFDIIRYVAKLSAEYQAVLNAIELTEGEHTCFYPCLDWYHLFALRLAIEATDRSTIAHKVCLMFDMGVGINGSVDLERVTNWLPHLRWAESTEAVELFAADSKILRSWEAIFPKGILVAMPSYLALWPTVPSKAKSSGKNRVLVYTGDVKADKGFSKLPAVVRELLADDSISEVVAQFTWNWDMPQFELARTELKELAARNERFRLYDQAWSHHEFAINLASCAAYYCTYDCDVYDNKSSGLPVWLGFYNIELLGNRPLALEEELKYLSKDEAYRKVIYSNLMDWFEK